MFGSSVRGAALLYAGAISVLGVFTAPFITIGSNHLASAFAVVACCASLLILAVVLLRERVITIPRSPLALGLPLLLVGAVSLFRVEPVRDGLWGAGFEVGTFGSLLLFAGAIFAGASVARRVVLFTGFFVAAALCTGTAALVWHLSGLPALFGIPPSPDTWMHVAFVVGAGLVCAVALTDARMGGRWGVAAAIAALLLALEFFVLFQRDVALLLLAAMIVVLAAHLIAYARKRTTKLPVAAILVTFAIVSSLLFGMRGPLLHVQADVRPSPFLTGFIVGPLYIETLVTPLIGTGPNTFGQAWDYARPRVLNTTPYWNITVDSAYSTAMTFMVTLGILGTAALFLPVAALAAALRNNFPGPLVAGDVATSDTVIIVALIVFSFGSMLVYPVGMPLFLLGAVALGLGTHSAGAGEQRVAMGRRTTIAIATAVAVCVAVLLFVTGSQLFAAMAYARATALPTDRISEKIILLDRAVLSWNTARYERELSRAYYERALTPGGTQKDLDDAVFHAEEATKKFPQDFAAGLHRASLFVALMQNDQGFVSRASDALTRVLKLSPTRPEVLLLQAYVELAQGNVEAARVEAGKAVTLKPTYVEALEFLEILE